MKNKLKTLLASQQENIKSLVIAVVLAFGVRTFAAQAYYIPSGSMLPTLQIDDKVFVDKISYNFRSPVRGEVIVFQPPFPTKDDVPLIKRIVGQPGDTVSVANGRLILNGIPQQEIYIAESPHYSMAPVKVPEEDYFVMGDNRNDSYDSHLWGFLPRKNIIGHAVFKYWPPNHAGGL
jgi:signal peptidase I